MKYQAGSDFTGGGKFVEEPGQYHMVIEDIAHPARNHKGERIEGGLFNVSLKVLAGSVEGQEDKEFNTTFFQPKADSKDGGDFARKKIDRFLLASNLLRDGDQGKTVDIDLDAAKHCQICLKLERKTNSKDKTKTYLDIEGAHIYHVDDVEVKNWEKRREALAVIPPKFRRVGGKPADQAQEPTVKPVNESSFEEI